jgi:hypothetical protein
MPNETDPFSDRIHIEQPEISAHIVVPEKERAAPQQVTVNTTLSPSRDGPRLERRDRSRRQLFARMQREKKSVEKAG